MNNEHEPQDLAVSEFAEKSHLCTVKCQAIIIASQKGQIDTLTAECERLAEVRNAAGSVDRNAARYLWLMENPEHVTWGDFYDRTSLGPSATVSDAIDAAMAAAPAKPEPAVQGTIDTPEFRKFMWDHWSGYGWNQGKQKCVDFINSHFAAPVAQPLAGQDVRAVTEATQAVCGEAARKLRTYVAIYTVDKQARRLADDLENIAAPSPVNPKQEQ